MSALFARLPVCRAVIPRKRNERHIMQPNPQVYRERDGIERMVNQLK